MIKVSSPHSNSFSKKPLEQELVDVLTKVQYRLNRHSILHNAFSIKKS